MEKTMTSFTVMTWNIENLFRFGADEGPKTAAAYESKLKELSAIIMELDPDVLALQEIGSEEAFGDLVDRLNGNYDHRQLSAMPDSRGIRVGFLSKLSID